MYAVGLVGGKGRLLLHLIGSVDEVSVSPDARHVAAAWRDRIIVARLLGADAGRISKVDLSSGTAVVSVNDSGGHYIAWQNSSTLTWAITDQIHRYHVDTGVT